MTPNPVAVIYHDAQGRRHMGQLLEREAVEGRAPDPRDFSTLRAWQEEVERRASIAWPTREHAQGKSKAEELAEAIRMSMAMDGPGARFYRHRW